MKTLLAATLSLAAFAAGAHEIDWKPYAGLAVTSNTYEDWIRGFPDDGGFNGGFSVDNSDEGFGVVVGIEPFQYLGFEAAYYDFGEARFVARSDGSGTTFAAGPVSETISTTVYEVNAVGRLPLPADFALFVRGGVSNNTSERTFSATVQPNTPGRDTRTDKEQVEVWGAGFEYRGWPSWRLVAAYTQRDVDMPNQTENAGIETLTLGAAYSW
jgi:hypothetical protein